MTAIEAPTTKLTHRQIMLVISGLMLGMMLSALDQSLLATALPTIVGDLGGLDQYSWVITAYMITMTATTPLYGKISDLFGRKALFQIAIVIFVAGSVFAGMAQSMGQLIAARAFQGAGGGGLMVMSMSIVGDILSPRERGRYQGYMGAVFALSSIAGPLLGGLFVDHLNWRWAFYVNVPVGLAAFLVTSSVLDLPFRRIRRRIDYEGATLLVGAVVAILLLTTWGGRQYAWGSSVILGLAAAALTLTSLFVIQEGRAVEPILPLRLFRNGVFNVTSTVGFLLGLTMFGTIIFLPLFLQVVTGVSATNSGLLLTPLMLGAVVSSVVIGRLITKTGRYKVFPLVGAALTTVTLLLFSTMDTHTSPTTVFAFMVLTGLGFGSVMQVLVIAVQNAVEQRDLGTATSASTFFRQMGGSFGVALFGTIFSHQLSARLGSAVVNSGDGMAALQNSPAKIRALPEQVMVQVVDAFSHALQTVFLWAVPLAVIAFVIALFLREIPLREDAYVGSQEATEPEATEPDEAGVIAPATIG